MKFPSFYSAEKVGTMFTPNTLQAVDEGRTQQIAPSATDTTRIALLLIDMQVDFIHTDGALSVQGAIGDTQRTIEWIYRNMTQLTTIAASLDSHYPIQIFSPAWWISPDGKHPSPYTVITNQDMLDKKWLPLYDKEWSLTYVERLEEHAKKQLMIWPYHTLIGTPGHNLTPALYEAIAYHTSARESQPILLHKGDEPRTEHYSIFEPEVKLPDKPTLDLNRPFLELLGTHDLVYVAGQAKSHCVLESVSSMMRFWGDKPHIISKIRILKDAMSSVYHPQIDFDAIANETFDRFVQHGLTMVTTQDSIG